jgi:tRNA A22 N-methylase
MDLRNKIRSQFTTRFIVRLDQVKIPISTQTNTACYNLVGMGSNPINRILTASNKKMGREQRLRSHTNSSLILNIKQEPFI